MLRRLSPSPFVLLGYIGISVAYFGSRVLDHPGKLLIGSSNQSDAEAFIWMFAWLPHAIAHGLNPFYSHLTYAPTGINLTWVTSVPGLAFVLAPVTALFGPSVAVNVAAILMPALSAWTAYFLCRYITGSTVAGIIGGYLYGFSSYMLAHEFATHLNLTSVFLVPLVVLVVLRFVRGDTSARRLAIWFGVIMGLQCYLSIEAALTLTIAFVTTYLLGLAIVRSARPKLVAALLPLLAGYGIAFLIASPIAYFVLTGTAPVYELADFYPADLANFVIPTHLIGWGGDTFKHFSDRFAGNDAERNAYLGIPILLMIVLFIWRRSRDRIAWFLIATFLVIGVYSLGTRLTIAGHSTIWMPWSIPGHITKVDLLPSRFTLYATLAADVIVAMWFASTRGRVFNRPYVLPALAIVALLPAFWKADYLWHPQRPEFFAHELYKNCIPSGERLLIFPVGHWGQSNLWQAESRFYFSMAEGNLGHTNQPQSFLDDPTNYKLTYYLLAPDRPLMTEVAELAKRSKIDRVLVVDGENWPDRHDLETFGPTQLYGGMLISPACGYPSLQGDKRKPPNA